MVKFWFFLKKVVKFWVDYLKFIMIILLPTVLIGKIITHLLFNIHVEGYQQYIHVIFYEEGYFYPSRYEKISQDVSSEEFVSFCWSVGAKWVLFLLDLFSFFWLLSKLKKELGWIFFFFFLFFISSIIVNSIINWNNMNYGEFIFNSEFLGIGLVKLYPSPDEKWNYIWSYVESKHFFYKDKIMTGVELKFREGFYWDEYIYFKLNWIDSDFFNQKVASFEKNADLIQVGELIIDEYFGFVSRKLKGTPELVNRTFNIEFVPTYFFNIRQNDAGLLDLIYKKYYPSPSWFNFWIYVPCFAFLIFSLLILFFGKNKINKNNNEKKKK